MQFLSSKSLLYIRIVSHFVLAYYLVQDPEGLVSAGFVILMGQAMQAPILHLSPSSPVLGMLAIFVSAQAISDLVPLLAENWNHFETLVPVRLFCYFLITAYIYFVPTSKVSNSLVATYAMLEVWTNFLIYNNLRDEKFYRMKKFVEENADAIRKAQDDQVRVIED
ncbi:hypothetical protein CANMA_003739 [Candida margitis]|uniref:uncharacterized protein n=1 Tax=Candida margitis TaxID=1775924 RepID=UPI002227A53A|nr:uncharacterized protein CANMA_003739 [Candida margitis]KAI5961762.1 hypothetical protein CANMA_003739 [Candida margitis]